MRLLGLLLTIIPALHCWELSLLHVNDIHARMEETSKYSSKCKEKDKMKGKCYGGLARMYTAVKNVKEQEENVLWLNAGDFYQVLGAKDTYTCLLRCMHLFFRALYGTLSSSGTWCQSSTTC